MFEGIARIPHNDRRGSPRPSRRRACGRRCAVGRFRLGHPVRDRFDRRACVRGPGRRSRPAGKRDAVGFSTPRLGGGRRFLRLSERRIGDQRGLGDLRRFRKPGPVRDVECLRRGLDDLDLRRRRDRGHGQRKGEGVGELEEVVGRLERIGRDRARDPGTARDPRVRHAVPDRRLGLRRDAPAGPDVGPEKPNLTIRPPPDVTPRLTAGGYVFPVYGPSSFGDTFGAPRGDVPSGWHHGEDIFGQLGEPLLAVADGTVFSVGWNDLGGYRLWLRDKAGNEFYYAHLSAYSPFAVNNRQVKAGTVLG